MSFVALPDSAAACTFTVIGASVATDSVRSLGLTLRIQTSFGGGISAALSSVAARAASSPKKTLDHVYGDAAGGRIDADDARGVLAVGQVGRLCGRGPCGCGRCGRRRRRRRPDPTVA
jgi:hypothetical protein